MAVLKKIKRAVRGDVKLTTVALEVIRRMRVVMRDRKERSLVERNVLFEPRMTRIEADGRFFDFDFFDSREVIEAAERILLGEEIQWRRDPLSNYDWPLEYHRDLKLMRGDGSDVRVVWEVNRLGHFVTLARAYALTKDERYSVEVLGQLRSWAEQNPYGRGPNWTCAMEVALRAMNLLAAFDAFRHSPHFDRPFLLQLFQQHGSYIERNLEFSYLATSNHYLSDVAGLLWLGLMLPELRDAKRWRDVGLRELLREMGKQVLPDGADFESSTGYHRFVTELFLYSFMLCGENGVEIDQKYWTKLHQMLMYIRSYLRPDGFAPLIGDTDSGQVLPVLRRRADDHRYLLTIGARVFNDPELERECESSSAFPHAGIYIMRRDDLYLCFNASDAGINGRGSHGHNDALSIEVSAHGTVFIVDPGTYVYSADLDERHKFRSTAYHSTVQIDGEEQNTTNRDTPFVIGNEAKPRVLAWDAGGRFEKVVAEHYGYTRLPSPVTHRRSVEFNRREGSWLIEDEFFTEGAHLYEIRFHFAPDLEITVSGASIEARAADKTLVIRALSTEVEPVLEPQATSHDYGQIRGSISGCWRISGRPGKLVWKISSEFKL
ncbi:MAG TPA: alginate lyase family protein [Pyrinomonadaceae bacterium]|nr:alginate lyase family protein [Pyrinomonadaceae bacterium]